MGKYRWKLPILCIILFVCVRYFVYRQADLNTAVPTSPHGGKAEIVTTVNYFAQISDNSKIMHNGTLIRELNGQQPKLNTVVPVLPQGGKVDIVSNSNSSVHSSDTSKMRHNGTLSIAIIGRLGNQMFQYASILGLADMMNFTQIAIHGGQDLLSSFQLSDKRVNFTRISTKWRTINELLCCAFDKRLTQFNNTEDVHVNGYLVSTKYFHNIKKHIKNEFKFVPRILTEAKIIKNDIAKQFNVTGINYTYIGVHVRRGDFLEKRNIEAGHFTVTKEFITRALQMCTKMFGNDTIFVFSSNGMDWVKYNFNNDTNLKMAFLEGNPAAVDMAVLSLCDHSIVSTGTYGWWAAWLAGGTTIISKQQAINESFLDKQFVYSEYFPPKWVILD
ncbi:hypothetical protein DPMN_194061 [Dreissena polymorpha]|uniref:L-Fucosyltransferase n=1 Tax=Dreissena polymorpha TaxID=45954 RepID=A0A9D3Y135_DREPO|nr:hypothetical protein DPMN_194061 [Dreissena polymorpha]